MFNGCPPVPAINLPETIIASIKYVISPKSSTASFLFLVLITRVIRQAISPSSLPSSTPIVRDSGIQCLSFDTLLQFSYDDDGEDWKCA